MISGVEHGVRHLRCFTPYYSLTVPVQNTNKDEKTTTAMIKTNKRILTAILLCCLSTAMLAVPALKGIKKTIVLDDGTKVEVELKGDEFCSWWQAEDGTCYSKSAEDNSYRIVDVKARLAEVRHLRVAENTANKERLAKARAAKASGRLGGSYTGTKRGIIILVNFADTKFGFGHNQAFYDRVANEENFTHTLGFVASVHDYYKTQSNGKFDIKFDVVGPYTLPQKYAYYGAHDNTKVDKRPGTMIATACKLADPDVDFSNYDWDGDGYVEQVFVLYAGDGENSNANDDLVWPHKGQLSKSDNGSAYVSGDNGACVNVYACASEYTSIVTSLGVKRNIDGIGTICHEYSHCLGLCDMYDTAGTGNYGMGKYDIMSAGNYNGNSFYPANFTAYEKWMSGWLEPTELSTPTTVKGMASTGQDYGQAFVIYNEAFPDEYYLLENRQTGTDLFDSKLPGSGLMIMHCDYKEAIWNNNEINSTVNYSSMYGDIYKDWDNDHERFTFFNADPTQLKDYALYPANGNNALTDTSLPAAKLYNSRAFMGKPITDIVQNADGTIDFNFMGGSDKNIVNGIQHVDNNDSKTVHAAYTIDGRKISPESRTLPHGLYIINGKKVVR